MPHKNIIHLYAFFYDRPKTVPRLKDCGDGIALFMLMEQLSQNMNEQLATLRRTTGPTVGWFILTILQVNFYFRYLIINVGYRTY